MAEVVTEHGGGRTARVVVDVLVALVRLFWRGDEFLNFGHWYPPRGAVENMGLNAKVRRAAGPFFYLITTSILSTGA
jgi:hypothetical protein